MMDSSDEPVEDQMHIDSDKDVDVDQGLSD